MAAFAENFDLDAFRELYDIREVNSLAEFLLPGHSLCIIHNPDGGSSKSVSMSMRLESAAQAGA